MERTSNNNRNANLKRCPKCGEYKPSTSAYFHRDKNSKDNYAHACKTCEAAYHHQWYLTHKNQAREKSKNWRKEHREQDRQRARSYHQNHKAEYKVRTQNYRARKYAAEGTHDNDDIIAQLNRQKRRCYYCGKHLKDKYHADHVIPLSRGGSDDLSNLVITCPQCNHSKNDRLPSEWPKGGKLL